MKKNVLKPMCLAMTAAVAGLGLAATVYAAEVGSGVTGVPMQETYDELAAIGQQYAPEVVTYEDGSQAQRTPDSATGWVLTGADFSYNNYYLNADNKGCNSCHTQGLGEVVKDMTFNHYELDNGLGTVIDVKDCVNCHTEHTDVTPSGENSLGTLVHGIHERSGIANNCMSCHVLPAGSDTLELWDFVKYDVLTGINSVADVQGEFWIEQDKVMGNDSGFTWWTDPSEEVVDLAFQGVVGDESAYENWTITVEGLVDNPFSMTLADLIAEAPSETVISSVQCSLNPISGELIGNFEATGIPVSWLLEKAGVQEGALSVQPTCAEHSAPYYGVMLEDVENEGGWLVYQINGEPLSYLEGFPCRMWSPQHGAPHNGRWATGIYVGDGSDIHYNEGMGVSGVRGGDGSWGGDPDMPGQNFANKPNVAICNIHEGQIIPVGEAFSFEGYADAFDELVTEIQFSMDRGQTWTSFAVEDQDPNQWVYWHFDFTPESEGGYVLSVRAVSKTGQITPMADEVLVNAKAAE